MFIQITRKEVVALGMFKKLVLILLLFGCSQKTHADGVRTRELSAEFSASKARIHIYRAEGREIQNILVLCPGKNADGRFLVESYKWQQFGREMALGVIGLSFSSTEHEFGSQRGYVYPEQGSGDLLFKSVFDETGGSMPVLFYGFSAGAHFASRIAGWQPQHVLAWCGHASGWWDEPETSAINPPGIIACGDEDGSLGASLTFFKAGRSKGKPWLWVSLPGVGHERSLPLEAFARSYFSVILGADRRLDPYVDGVWVDIDRLVPVNVREEPPSVTGWLPDVSLFEEWKALNEP